MYRNKWNGRTYTLVRSTNGIVLLKRDDGSEFEISNSEFKFSYVEVKHD